MDSGLRRTGKFPFLEGVKHLGKNMNALVLLGFVNMCLLMCAIYLAVFTSYSNYAIILTGIFLFDFAAVLYVRIHLKWGT